MRSARRCSLFCGEAVDAGLGVGIAGDEEGRGEVGVVAGIRPLLGLQNQAAAELERFAILSEVGTVEEVATVELEAGLVGQHFQEAPRPGLIDRADEFHAVGLLVDTPIVVVPAGIAKLVEVVIDPLPDGMRLPEIHRRAHDRSHFAGRNALRIDRNEMAGLDIDFMTQDGSLAFSSR